MNINIFLRTTFLAVTSSLPTVGYGASVDFFVGSSYHLLDQRIADMGGIDWEINFGDISLPAFGEIVYGDSISPFATFEDLTGYQSNILTSWGREISCNDSAFDECEIGITFTNPVYDIFLFDAGPFNHSLKVDFYDQSGSLFYSNMLVQAGEPGFVASSDVAIARVIVSRVFSDGSPADDSVAIFRVGSVVPLPAAAWLFGTGLIGLIGIAKRKKA